MLSLVNKGFQGFQGFGVLGFRVLGFQGLGLKEP